MANATTLRRYWHCYRHAGWRVRLSNPALRTRRPARPHDRERTGADRSWIPRQHWCRVAQHRMATVQGTRRGSHRAAAAPLFRRARGPSGRSPPRGGRRARRRRIRVEWALEPQNDERHVPKLPGCLAMHPIPVIPPPRYTRRLTASGSPPPAAPAPLAWSSESGPHLNERFGLCRPRRSEWPVDRHR